MKQFYVYIHKKPDGTPFYVGKGLHRRATQFACRTKWHKNIVAKYGIENIIVHQFLCQSEQDAFDTERLFIRLLKEKGIELVNLTDGGEGSSGYTPTDETKRKLKKTPQQREVLAALKRGTTQSKETIAKKIASMTGLKRSEEFKEKQRQARLGVTHTEQARKKIAAAKTGKPSWNKGKSFSEASKQKMSLAKKGKAQTPEHKAKRLAACAAARAKRKALQETHNLV